MLEYLHTFSGIMAGLCVATLVVLSFLPGPKTPGKRRR